jgi:hypothetical protein
MNFLLLESVPEAALDGCRVGETHRESLTSVGFTHPTKPNSTLPGQTLSSSFALLREKP